MLVFQRGSCHRQSLRSRHRRAGIGGKGTCSTTTRSARQPVLERDVRAHSHLEVMKFSQSICREAFGGPVRRRPRRRRACRRRSADREAGDQRRAARLPAKRRASNSSVHRPRTRDPVRGAETRGEPTVQPTRVAAVATCSRTSRHRRITVRPVLHLADAICTARMVREQCRAAAQHHRRCAASTPRPRGRGRRRRRPRRLARASRRRDRRSRAAARPSSRNSRGSVPPRSLPSADREHGHGGDEHEPAEPRDPGQRRCLPAHEPRRLEQREYRERDQREREQQMRDHEVRIEVEVDDDGAERRLGELAAQTAVASQRPRRPRPRVQAMPRWPARVS